MLKWREIGMAALWAGQFASPVRGEAVYDGNARTITVTGKGNTLRSVTQQVDDPDVISYDYLGRSASCRANLLITTGELTVEGETLELDASATNRLMITVYPVGQLAVLNSTIGPIQEARGGVWGIDVNGSGGVLIIKDSEVISGGIHNGTGSSPKIVAENVVFRKGEAALNIYFPPTPDSRFDRLTFMDRLGHAVVAVGKANLFLSNASFSTNTRAFYFSREGRVTTVHCSPMAAAADSVVFDKDATGKAGWINQCYLRLNVVDQRQRPIPDAEVTLTDSDGQTEFAGKTDAAGWLTQGTETNLPITVSIQTRGGRRSRGPHLIKVTYQGQMREDAVSMESAGTDQPVLKTVIWKGE